MFREMRRSKQAMTPQECIEVLIQQPRGVLSVLGDDGYPYGMPMDHWYSKQDGKLYFHCAKAGHKIDAIRACDKVSYCVTDEGVRQDDDWPLHFRSVVVFGRIRPVEDADKAETICRSLCRKFTDYAAYIDREWQKAHSAVLCLELTPEHITGKRVKES